MRIVIITQDEPFYLAKNLSYLIKIFPEHSEIVGCVVADVSPFGKKESFVKKAKKTFDVFGLHFFCYYSFKYLVSKLDSKTNVFTISAALSHFRINCGREGPTMVCQDRNNRDILVWI